MMCHKLPNQIHDQAIWHGNFLDVSDRQCIMSIFTWRQNFRFPNVTNGGSQLVCDSIKLRPLYQRDTMQQLYRNIDHLNRIALLWIRPGLKSERVVMEALLKSALFLPGQDWFNYTTNQIVWEINVKTCQLHIKGTIQAFGCLLLLEQAGYLG